MCVCKYGHIEVSYRNFLSHVVDVKKLSQTNL